MSKSVKAKTPCHGEQVVKAVDVTVVLPDDDERPFYVFTCPECKGGVRNPADNRIVAILAKQGSPIADLAAEAALAYDDDEINKLLGGKP